MGWSDRLVSVFRSNRLQREINAEVATHLAERTDDLIAEGRTPAEAAAEARRRFGNRGQQQEQVRDADSLAWLESVLADVRYGLRALRMSPGFTTIAVLSLALGIGANTAIFSLINALALRALPVQHPEELVMVTMGTDGGDTFTNPLWEQVRDQKSIFASSLAYGRTDFNLANGGEVQRARGSWVSGSYFNTLGVLPVAGRLLQPADDVRGCAALASVSAGFASRRFGSAAGAVGKTISLNGHPFEITGVADPGFTGVEVGRDVEVFAPLCSEAITTGQPNVLDERRRWYLSILARPLPGVPFDAVLARLKVASLPVFQATMVSEERDAGIRSSYLNKTLSAIRAANGQSDFRDAYHKALMVLMVVSGAVLLIACANIANLLLARAATRQRELAIRLAIGAGRLRLVRQLLTESLLLSAGGVLLGILFAQWAARLMVSFLSSSSTAIWLDLSLDGRVLAFTIALAVITGVLFGLAPAWRATRVDPQEAMKSGGRGLSGDTRHRIGKVLVMGQVALSLTLIAAAGLLLNSFHKLTTLDLGFQRNGIALITVNFEAGGFKEGEFVVQAMETLRQLRGIRGVDAVGASLMTPVSGMGWNDLVIAPGFSPKSFRDSLANFNSATDGYFGAMGSRLLYGRDFTANEILGARNVAVINLAMARKLFGTDNPVGRSFRKPRDPDGGAPQEIIGVVEDAKYHHVDEVPTPFAFLPLGAGGIPAAEINYELRTTRGLAEVMADVKTVIGGINPGISIKGTLLSEQVASSIKRPRLLAVLSGFFGALALLLAMIGLYGTIAYTVARRRNEIGIRMALGASRAQVLRMVIGDAGRIVLGGIVLGALLTFATTRLISSFLYGITATDPATLAGSALALAATALAAASIPALRAVRLSPTEAIRHE